MGYLTDDSGNKSLMRLLAFMGFFLGGAVAIAGVIAMFLKLPTGIAVAIGTGLGLAGGGEAAKAIQKRAEK